jgi:hypothetical protein
VDYRNVALAMIALADCRLCRGDYLIATTVVDSALRLYPNLTDLQKAEALRLKANATIAKDRIRRVPGQTVGTYSPVKFLEMAYILDPSCVQYTTLAAIQV